MKDTAPIIFADNLAGITRPEHADATLHIFCHRGDMSLALHEQRYDIVARDYAILPNLSLVSQVVVSADFRADIMYLSDNFIRHLLPHNNYGIFGHVSLLQNPVMQLTEADYRHCCEDVALIRRRLPLTSHLFYEEMVEHLAMVHVLNLYDIHARQMQRRDIPKRATEILQRFIALLDEGHYVRHRDIPFYADRLCITPHYLTDACKVATGQPASYWIDLYMQTEVARQLRDKSLSFAAIADRMGFSSPSYFTRYVQKLFGLSPSAFRNRFR